MPPGSCLYLILSLRVKRSTGKMRAESPWKGQNWRCLLIDTSAACAYSSASLFGGRRDGAVFFPFDPAFQICSGSNKLALESAGSTTPDQWRELEELYGAVQDLSEAQKTLVLDRANPPSRERLEVILRQDGSALDQPAWVGRRDRGHQDAFVGADGRSGFTGEVACCRKPAPDRR